jgi:GNAT superfamily N-acetyltransferase
VTSVAATGKLLGEVFPGARVASADYLDWLYVSSPFGSVIEANSDDRSGRAAHYALVPIDMVENGNDVRGALSLNTAVHPRARGRGAFTDLAASAYEAAREAGVECVVGVANENSTHGFVKRLGFELVSSLPATVLVPTPGPLASVRSAWCTEDCFREGGLAADVEHLLRPPKAGMARRWTPRTLRWRLADPTARYALHLSPDALVVSARDARHGVGVAMLLKVFAPTGVSAAGARALVRAACRFHRAPLALYVGINERAGLRGAKLPQRFRESPLNLIYRRLDGARPSPSFASFEFLDFDAY